VKAIFYLAENQRVSKKKKVSFKGDLKSNLFCLYRSLIYMVGMPFLGDRFSI
jgi:hypothetical protein